MSCGRVVLYVLVGALAALFAIPAPSILSVENVDACIQASKAQKPGALPSFSLRKNAEFDVILFGATGFTGNLTARYLSRQQTHRNFTFAIAGRSQRKLDTLASSLPHPPSIFVADAGDLDALRALVRRTKVLITTAGEACVSECGCECVFGMVWCFHPVCWLHSVTFLDDCL